MARVMYCTMSMSELKAASQQAGIMGIDLYPYLLENLDLDGCRSILEEAYDKGVNAIICRGQILLLLKSLSGRIPLVPNYFSASETLDILRVIRDSYGKDLPQDHPLRVCLLSHQALYVDEEGLGDVFGFYIHNEVLPKESFDEMEDYLRGLQKSGNYDCVVCGQSISPIAEQIGWRAFTQIISSRSGRFMDVLQVADIVAESEATRKSYWGNLQTIMENAFEAIILLDAEGNILYINQRTKLRLKLLDREYTGLKVWDVVSQIDRSMVEGVLKGEEDIFGRVLQIEEYSIVLNVSAVHDGKKISGGIMQFTELHAIEKMTEAAHKELYLKGHTAKYTLDGMLGKSPAMMQAKRIAEQFAQYDSNVLILGETGIGKEVFAQSIHNASPRKDKPFVAINCGAIPLNLLESELFGYVDGAFTGASKKGKKGLLEIADGGTIFLDEISEMDPAGQVQLLRVLEERKIHKIGDDKETVVNVRVIAACNRNLRQYVEEGKFREDLYYRLNVLTLRIPPLRERGTDIIDLAEHFLTAVGQKYQKIIRLDEDAREVFLQYSWPGNVRQLKNFCERLIVVAIQNQVSREFVVQQLKDSFMVTEDELKNSEFKRIPVETQERAAKAGETLDSSGRNLSEDSLSEADAEGKLTSDSGQEAAGPAQRGKEVAEKERIQQALNQYGGSRKAVGEALGMSKATLWRKMKKYGIGEKF